MAPRLLAVLVAALVCAPAAQAAAPSNLHPFLLTSGEPVAAGRTYSRTPSFAWNKVTGAKSYEFELATGPKFSENAVVWSKDDLTTPLTTVPITLPWVTGSPYSFYARVRARTAKGATAWSAAYGFKLKAPGAPTNLTTTPNSEPGMVRWTPVDGATAYEVTFLFDLASGFVKKIKTATTAADLREYYSLHNQLPGMIGITWRVRAMRELEGQPANSIPTVSYGPWSGYFSTTEPALNAVQLNPLGAVSRSGSSDVFSGIPGPGPNPHELVPGFYWDGLYSTDGFGDCPPDIAATNVTCPLFHVYVYTDEDCSNRVHVSDLVGSPAYVPRLTPSLKYPASPGDLAKVHVPFNPIPPGTPETFLILEDGDEGKVYDAGGEQVYAAGMDPNLPPSTKPVPAGKKVDRRSGLWDNDWPTGNYYWTVVPAVPYITPDSTVEYHDVGFSEDMCQSSLAGTFGKTSAPAIEKAAGVPYVSGITATGSVLGAKSTTPAFFGKVVVAWKPAPGASRYEVQWSRKKAPFKAAGSAKTASTSALLNLQDGVWFYRVRGLDESIPAAAQGMTWSDPQYLRILPRTFTVARRGR